MSSEENNKKDDNNDVMNIEENDKIENDELKNLFDEYCLNEIEFRNSNNINELKNLLDLYQQNIFLSEREDDIALKIKEKCIYHMTSLQAHFELYNDIVGILSNNSDFFSKIPKAKTAKIVRNILSQLSSQLTTSDDMNTDNRVDIGSSLQPLIDLCNEVIEWCKKERRNFLRQRIQVQLVSFLYKEGKRLSQLNQTNNLFEDALNLASKLIGELKKLDDKQLLVECHLSESHLHHALGNIAKAKAALTATRSNANSIYVLPLMQADIDEMSGILHCEENEYFTSYSYFLEAFEGYDNLQKDNISDDEKKLLKRKATKCLKYMIICKILKGLSKDVNSLLNSKKIAMNYASSLEIIALKEFSDAAVERSLEKFQQGVEKYREMLESDLLIKNQLDKLYNDMLDSNLIKLIEPFSCVEISHIAELINLDINIVERRLSNMILDSKISATLDQGNGQLILFESNLEDKTFTHAIDVIDNLEKVVGGLFQRAKHIL